MFNWMDGHRERRSAGRGHRGGRGERDRGVAGHGHARRGGRTLKRFFAHGDLRFLILKLIADKPRHGYELIKEIEEGVAGAYSPSPGVIYPTLTLLEELGWLRAVDSDGSKKLYEITAEGSMALEASRATVDAILARMAEARDAAPAREADEPAAFPEIGRAMAELRRALDERLTAGPVEAERLRAIAAAIAAAAAAISKA